jgi:tetratricopeptide (TPR) repeat protein
MDYSAVASADRNNYDAFLNRGISYRKLTNFENAFNDFSDCIRMQALRPDGYINRGIVHRMKKDYELAVSDYTQALVHDPGNSDAFYNRGIAYSKQDHHQMSIADFSKAIKINPKDADSYMNRGLELIIMGKKADGCYDIKKAADLGLASAIDERNRFCKE